MKLLTIQFIAILLGIISISSCKRCDLQILENPNFKDEIRGNISLHNNGSDYVQY